MDWLEHIRSTIPWHTASVYLEGVRKHTREYIGRDAYELRFINQDNKSLLCTTSSVIQRIGSHMLKSLDQLIFRKKLFLVMDHKIRQIRKVSETLGKEDMKKIDDKKLFEKYKEIVKRTAEFSGMTMQVLNAFDVYFEDKLKDKLNKLMKKKLGTRPSQKLFANEYTALTTPHELTAFDKERILLLALADEINAHAKLKELFYKKVPTSREFASFKSFCSLLSQLEEKFWWISVGFSDTKRKTQREYLIEVRELLQEEQNLAQEIKKMAKLRKSHEKGRAELIQRYGKDDELIKLLKIFKSYYSYFYEIQECYGKANFFMDLLLNEFAKRKNIRPDFLRWMSSNEVIDFIQTGRVDKEELKKRKTALFYESNSPDAYELYSGDDAKKKILERMSKSGERIIDFEGVPASQGWVTGVAFVSDKPEKADLNLKDREILVTSTMDKEFLTSIMRAGAVVLDNCADGSHISGDLGIPTVSNTSIATKLIKSGDVIRVDAQRGLVKIIKKVDG